MSIATDLQNIVGDISAAIAGRKSWGRTELERLRRQLDAARREASQQEASGTVSRLILDDLLSSIDRGVIDLHAAAEHARTRAALPSARSPHA